MDCVSVVMAAFNGEKYLSEQIESIITQLQSDDELLISDDGSSDRTREIVLDYMARYPNIHLINGPQTGICKNFEHCINEAHNPIILLADQDDYWINGKIQAARVVFNEHPECNVFLHNAGYCDSEGNFLPGETFVDRGTRHGSFRNWLKSGYYGCCMGLRKSFADKILPFPVKGVLHDQYIGLIAESEKSAFFSSEKWILHRIHGDNYTKRQSLRGMVKHRLRLLCSFLIYKKRVKKQ